MTGEEDSDSLAGGTRNAEADKILEVELTGKWELERSLEQMPAKFKGFVEDFTKRNPDVKSLRARVGQSGGEGYREIQVLIEDTDNATVSVYSSDLNEQAGDFENRRSLIYIKEPENKTTINIHAGNRTVIHHYSGGELATRSATTGTGTPDAELAKAADELSGLLDEFKDKDEGYFDIYETSTTVTRHGLPGPDSEAPGDPRLN